MVAFCEPLLGLPRGVTRFRVSYESFAIRFAMGSTHINGLLLEPSLVSSFQVPTICQGARASHLARQYMGCPPVVVGPPTR